MNERAWKLVTEHRRVMAMLPGAMSSSIFEGRSWTLISVGALTDDAVYSLALLLGISAPAERRIATPDGPVSWLYASSERTERGRGLVKIDIAGPRRREVG